MGLTNAQIAERLVISTGTVKWYMSMIYSKLAVEHRVQALVRAQELQLL
jgi:LuxR family maltose regulon positive regulatory protein